MELYKKNRAEFQRKTKIKDYMYISPPVVQFGEPSEPTPKQLPSTKQMPEKFNELPAKENPDCFTKLQIKLPNHTADYPLMYLEHLWKSLSFHMSLPPTTLLFDIVLSGSVVVVWLIPTEISPQVLHQARCSGYFYKSLRIQKVIISEDCIYDDKSVADDVEKMVRLVNNSS